MSTHVSVALVICDYDNDIRLTFFRHRWKRPAGKYKQNKKAMHTSGSPWVHLIGLNSINVPQSPSE